MAKGRLFLCRWCRKKSPDEEMQLVLHGSQKHRYHLDGCYQAYVQDQEFKKKEKEELDDLVETIKEVHGIDTLPNQFFSYLQDIRNGNELFGKIGRKKKKQGYKYHVIEETYKQIQDSIDWAKRTKEFKNTMNMLRYTKAILVNEIQGVQDMLTEKEYDEEMRKDKEIDQDVTYYNDDSDYKKKSNDNDEMDISKFL